MLYNDEGEIAAEGDLSMPIEGAAIRRPGTVAASSPMAV
jgi:hypothetical protein